MELVALKSDKMKVQIEDTSVRMIADRCRFNPRHAENILRTCSDFMSVLSEDRITISVAEETLVNLGIDSLGLTEDDRKILFTIAETFNGGPIGVDSIALASNVDKDTVTDTVEPLLLRHGLIERQPRGRKITKEGLEHLVIVGAEQSELL
jgi:Holliday junction DNA helicase RuvB